MSEFERQIQEDIDLVRGGQRLPRANIHFLSEEEYRAYEEMKRAPVMTMKEEPARQNAMMRIANVLVPIFVGATWILGAVEGLADPIFTAVTTGICGLWAVVSCKWGAVNA